MAIFDHVSGHCGLKCYSRRLDVLLSPLRREQLCLNKDAGDGNICYQKNSKCCTMGGRGGGVKSKKTNTFACLFLAHFLNWADSSKVSGGEKGADAVK